MLRRFPWLLVSLLTVVGSAAAREPLRVVATTTLVGDLVREVVGEDAVVETLMGPGVDPHLFKPTASDVLRLQRAEVVFFNGLMLEGKMAEVLGRLARSDRPVQAVTDGLAADDLLHPPGFEGHPDPHVWFDINLWSRCLATVEQVMVARDPDNAARYRERAAAARRRYAALHEWAVAKVGELPAARRILVTSHDAYNYFGRAYGFTVVGLQGISTATEAGLADVARLVDFIRQHRIKAIFVESSVPHATIERVARDSGAAVGGELFSDALGTPGLMEQGHDLGTYEGMVRHNILTIVEALK